MRIITEEPPKARINIDAHLELQHQMDEFVKRGGKVKECPSCKMSIEHVSSKKGKDGEIINGYRDDREHSRRANARHAYSGHKYISKEGEKFRFMWQRKFKCSGTLDECVKARNEFLKAKKLPIPD